MDEIVVSSLSANNLSSNNQLATVSKQPNNASTVSNHELAIRERLTSFQRLTSYSLETFVGQTSADDIPIKGFNDGLPEINNPLIEQDRKKAIEKINNLLLKIDKLKQEHHLIADSKPVCPYEQTKLEYLGSNFIVPSIHDLPTPTNFSVETAVNSNLLISKQMHENMTTQMLLMSAEAIKPDFSGNLPEVLGHAFTMLSATANGEQIRVIDRHKTALHLEFAEIVRNIPISYIIENPLEVAQKLIERYTQINKDYLKQQLLMITE